FINVHATSKAAPRSMPFLRAARRRLKVTLIRARGGRLGVVQPKGFFASLQKNHGEEKMQGRQAFDGLAVKLSASGQPLNDQRCTLRFSADVLPLFETSSYSTICPSFRPLRPAFSTAEI